MSVKVARWTRTEGGPRAETLARIATSDVRLRAQPGKTDRRIETPDGVRMDAEVDQARTTTLAIVKDVVSRSTRNWSRRDADVPTNASASLGVAKLGNVEAEPARRSRKMDEDVDTGLQRRTGIASGRLMLL